MAKKKITPEEEAVIAQLVRCRDDLAQYVYTTQNWDCLLNDRPDFWIRAKAPVYVAHKVQEFIETPSVGAYSILILSEPPQHSKSTTVTETAPSWCAGKYPDKRQMIISYNDDTATPFLRKNTEKIERFGPDIFGIGVKRSTAIEVEISGGRGSIISRGIGSGITGKPGDIIWIDDPIKNREEADSEASRERVWAEWNDTIKTRLSAGAKVILIMTRWHEDDLAGRIIKYENPKNVTVIRLPCEAEEDDPLGRKVGDALCPEMGKDNAWLADFKAAYMRANGSRSWNALFQGRPTSDQGNVLKRHWWRYWKPTGVILPPVSVKLSDGATMSIEAEDYPGWIDEEIQSWDCTFKDTAGTDRVAGQLWARHGAKIYLKDRVKDRMDIVKTMQAIETMTANHPKALEKLVEDKANGPAVIQMLRRRVFGLIAVNPLGSKVSRVNAVSPAIEAGNVFLPHPSIAPWVNDFIEECAAFPSGSHDDDVDSMSQALNRLIYRTKSRDPASKQAYDGSTEARVARDIKRMNDRYRNGHETELV